MDLALLKMTRNEKSASSHPPPPAQALRPLVVTFLLPSPQQPAPHLLDSQTCLVCPWRVSGILHPVCGPSWPQLTSGPSGRRCRRLAFYCEWCAAMNTRPLPLLVKPMALASGRSCMCAEPRGPSLCLVPQLDRCVAKVEAATEARSGFLLLTFWSSHSLSRPPAPAAPWGQYFMCFSPLSPAGCCVVLDSETSPLLFHFSG